VLDHLGVAGIVDDDVDPRVVAYSRSKVTFCRHNLSGSQASPDAELSPYGVPAKGWRNPAWPPLELEDVEANKPPRLPRSVPAPRAFSWGLTRPPRRPEQPRPRRHRPSALRPLTPGARSYGNLRASRFPTARSPECRPTNHSNPACPTPSYPR